ncbi:hypothetical protein MNBD_ACTINO01-1698 [hydrothermal vent metagenome]|uniref:DUF4870 domain-containing protein n=1 Tax=hydrothermal vent metagenome TaxID=652676 RepID=A0A3B0RDV4_9ZZZZ
MTDQPPSDVPEADSDSRAWAVAAHLLPWVGLGFLGPLIIWLIKRDESPYVEEHAREALNFQISFLIYMIVSALLMLVVIGFFLFIGIGIFGFVVMIIAAIKAANGERYRYPLTIRFINPKVPTA